jgi:hypothetical protein
VRCETLRCLQLHQDRGKALCQRVVDVTRDPVSFLEDGLPSCLERLCSAGRLWWSASVACLAIASTIVRRQMFRRPTPAWCRGDPSQVARGQRERAMIVDSMPRPGRILCPGGKRGSSPSYSTVVVQPSV